MSLYEMKQKKYPVTYREKEYEVRWEKELWDYLRIYEVKTYKFKILDLLKITKLKLVYNICEADIKNYLFDNGVKDNDPNYFIKEIEALFEFYEYSNRREIEKAETDIKQKKALEKWDGIING